MAKVPDFVSPMILPKPESPRRIGCLIALILFSAYSAAMLYTTSSGPWQFFAAFGTLAFASIFLRVGWFVPFAIAGAYFGMLSDVRVKHGPIESQMEQTVTSIVAGTIFGFVIGAVIDTFRYWNPEPNNADEPPVESDGE